MTFIDPWFLAQLRDLHTTETWLKSGVSLADLTPADFGEVKRRGFSDPQIGAALGVDALTVRAARTAAGVTPSFRRVDTCAAEFAAETPYMYSCYDGNDESAPTNNKKVLILGGGPNRIGQGIEFDYCCCHASFALRDAGYETIMMNSNPETVSTDYDTSSRLYFEPLTVEDVLNVIETERPDGIIVQFGGQTPLKLATPIAKYLAANPLQAASGAGPVRIWGTQPESIDAAEDRDLWYTVLQGLNIRQPPGSVVSSEEEAVKAANGLGYPVMVRPSFVLGGRAMEIVYSEKDVRRYINTAVEVDPERPVLVDKVGRGGGGGATRAGANKKRKTHAPPSPSPSTVPGPRRRDRRRRPVRHGRQRDHLRHHAAHRASGRPLWRLGVLHPDADHRRRRAGRHPGLDAQNRARAQSGGRRGGRGEEGERGARPARAPPPPPPPPPRSACSTSSFACRTATCTSSRPTPARRAPCRLSRKRSATPWPRTRPC